VNLDCALVETRNQGESCKDTDLAAAALRSKLAATFFDRLLALNEFRWPEEQR
jgi:hypothetical protein